MATLERIRKRAGVLIAVIVGLALFAFVLGDLLNGKSAISCSRDQNIIAEINGEEVSADYFAKRYGQMLDAAKGADGKEMTELETEQAFNQAWEYVLQEVIRGAEFEKLGLAVTNEELFDMVQGNNIDQRVKQAFTSPEGRFDPAVVVNYLQNLENDPVAEARWKLFEEDLLNSRRVTKYNNMIKKGYYVPSIFAKNEIVNKTRRATISFVGQRFGVVDSTITVTDAEVEKYFNEHIKEYKRETSRDVDYVAFDIIPTSEDSAATKQYISGLISEFKIAENNYNYISLNSDEAYSDKFLKAVELSPAIDSSVFDTVEGTIYGPYIEGGSMKITKVISIKQLPDSVRASHILIKAASQEEYVAAEKVVDSLINLINNGTDFALLAMLHGTDGTKEKGGDLDWFIRDNMVYPFNDTCFFSEVGHVTKVATQFGWHVVKVTGKKEAFPKVKLGTVAIKIDPSSATRQSVYAQASEFSGLNQTKEKFEAAIKEKNMMTRHAPNLLENNRNLMGIPGNYREVIRWAFEADLNSVSHVCEVGDRYIVAMLVAIHEEGTIPIEEKRLDIEIKIKKEKQSEKTMTNISGLLAKSNTLEGLASELQANIETAQGVTFNSCTLTGFGNELAVGAAAVTVEKDKIYGPIAGKNGVYVIIVNDLTEAMETDNYKTEQETLARGFAGTVDWKSMETLKEISEIKDYRSKHY